MKLGALEQHYVSSLRLAHFLSLHVSLTSHSPPLLNTLAKLLVVSPHTRLPWTRGAQPAWGVMRWQGGTHGILVWLKWYSYFLSNIETWRGPNQGFAWGYFLFKKEIGRWKNRSITEYWDPKASSSLKSCRECCLCLLTTPGVKTPPL